ncbi:MAG: hypothetical protein JW940_00865 [Polyangiaceae bacterium]|nr:hypothetical protein [Polyangiaceae bacterium]
MSLPWIASARDDRELVEELERAATKWQDASQDPSLLWRKRQLARVRDLLGEGRVKVSADAQKFVRIARSVERRGQIALVMTAVAVLVLGMAGTAWYIDLQRRTNDSLRVANVRAEKALQEAKRERARAESSEKTANKAAADATQANQESQRLKLQFQEELASLESRVEKAKTAAEFAQIKKDSSRKRASRPSRRRASNTRRSPKPALPRPWARRPDYGIPIVREPSFFTAVAAVPVTCTSVGIASLDFLIR